MVGVAGGEVGSASGPIRKAGGGGVLSVYGPIRKGGGGGGGCCRCLAQNEERRGGGGAVGFWPDTKGEGGGGGVEEYDRVSGGPGYSTVEFMRADINRQRNRAAILHNQFSTYLNQVDYRSYVIH